LNTEVGEDGNKREAHNSLTHYSR